MNGRLYNQRRATQERRRAALALTEQARRIHLELAEMFEARIGPHPAAAEDSNVVQLHPKETPEGAVPPPGSAEPKRKQGRRRSQ